MAEGRRDGATRAVMEPTRRRSSQGSSIPPRARPHAIAVVLGAPAATPMVLGVIGDRVALFALADHFQAQYALALASTVVVLLALRRWRFAALFGALLVVPAARMAPYVVPTRAASTNGPRVSVMLINVQTENLRHDLVVAEVRRLRPDVVVFEEVDAVWLAALTSSLGAWPHRVVAARSDNFGLAVFSALPMEGRVVYLGDGAVPSVDATVGVGGRSVRLLATHPVPAMDAVGMSQRDAQLAALANVIRRGQPTLVVGDLNATPWSRPLRALRDTTGLVDSLRGHGVQPSWPAEVPWIGRITIDHVLHSTHLVTDARALGGSVGSDHRPVYVRLVLRQVGR